MKISCIFREELPLSLSVSAFSTNFSTCAGVRLDAPWSIQPHRWKIFKNSEYIQALHPSYTEGTL